ncbi:hypothetical protein GXW78_23265 [Roseomonas terrae]|uniref:EF-hand domain-containing protein n=1 Tax=Neoroseomonas terrae TaxID=424799 RepID=A0ABS5ENJ7_9PROT|nr:hypothetical protein [Neoroseomonas terrae]MBR0652596.1 hypothetical protein [Neoroseomonas terrae]
MKRLVLAALLMAAAPATASGVPEAMRGTWAAGSCTSPDALLHVTARSVAKLPAAGPARLVRFRAMREQDGWTLGIGAGAEAPRIMLRPDGAALDLAEPDVKLRDDRLPGATRVTRWTRCSAGSVGPAVLHGEGMAFLGTLERLEAACQGGAVQACINSLVAEADVSGDGALSPAEIARLLRGAAWALALQQGSEPDAIAAAGGLGGIAALAAARLLVASLDYDGDGRLSLAELGWDRLAFPPGTGSAEGQAGTIEALADGAGLLRSLIEQMAVE